MKIYAYKNGSKSARALADALGVKILKHEGKPIKVKGTLLNWGASRIERAVNYYNIINMPGSVAKASNKLSSFTAFKEAGVATPEWTTSREEALKWLENGFDVVCRHKLTGHSGEGIEIVPANDLGHVLEQSPLYTKYVKKEQEYRIHVFRGEVIFQQRKARKKEVPDEEVNWKVRNLAGGFIFANVDIEAPFNCQEEAVKAVAALALDFGAVDVITDRRGNAYVLEVNTACGLEGTTIKKYVEKFQQFM